MTIKRRLMIMLAVPLLVLLSIGIYSLVQLAKVEVRARFMAENQVQSLAALGNISRSFTEMRVNVRSHLLAGNKTEQSEARAMFDADKANLTRLLQHYGDALISDAKDQRMLNNYRTMSDQWIAGAEKVMALATMGRRDEAAALLHGSVAALGMRLSTMSSEWIQHEEQLATDAGKDVISSIDTSRLNMMIAFAIALAFSGCLGFLTLRKIVNPIHALQTSVESIARGDYTKEVPFTKTTDETGALARAVEVLKQGAAAMEEQRWVKSNAAKLTGELHGATSLAEFGQHFISSLMPVIGGGVAAFYLVEKNSEHIRRIASYGLAEGANSADMVLMGQGLVGQCARERKQVTLANLPPDYLRISSGLGGAAPANAIVWPMMSEDTCLGVLEIASFRALNTNENTLIEELLPVVSMSLEILQRNLNTRNLLEQIRMSEERTRLILESSAEGIFGVDTEGGITFVNPAACRMLKFNAGELIGQPSHSLIHHHRPDGSDYPMEQCPMFAAYKRGESSRIDDEFLWRKDGSGLPVEYGATPILKDSAIVGAVISFTDITERKRAEGELKKRTDELQHINFLADSALDLTKAGYWHVPLDGSGRYNSSERAARIFGDLPTPDHRYTLAHWMEHVRLGDEAAAKTTAENFEAAVAGQIPFYDAIYAYKRPVDGRVVWIHALGHVVKDESGKPGDMYGVTQDITEFKLLEMELTGATQKAEEATEMKSMFLANMSHEIRTPMNAIIGLSHLALKTQMTPKQRDYISKVHNAGTSLLTVINDILDFSKIEAGKLDIETTDFKLDEIISSVTTLTAQKAHDKGLEFLAQVAPGIPEHLLGDPLRLGQILTNLVNNAVKFTERGEIQLKIELLEHTGEKVQLKFSVRDTGIGMTQEQAARLFQAFSQADMSTTRKHGGTGLGLSISRRLVELMAGRIWLESEPGVGSTFFFTVWLEVGAAQGSGKLYPERLAQLRVLIVDDNATAREILQEPLGTFASRVDAVASGPEAIAAVKQHDTIEPYDIIFMDWRMPGMDGLQASRHIKSDETLGHQPAIVLVTAFGREEVREEAERLQLDGFLVKPVTKSMLVDTLLNVFASPVDEYAAGAHLVNEDTARLKGMRILLTEDNEINQQIAIELLEGVGAKVEVANNGREAVEKLTASPTGFDVVLMDLQMPEMDGYQATARIRADAQFTNLPVIAMTAHTTVEERQRCLAAGMNDHISKPIDPAMLYDTVAKYYNPATSGATPMAPLPAADAETDSDLPEIKGLDTSAGLLRVAGNKKLYRKLLRQFAEQQADAADRVQQALATGDTATAERIAHTLKGVAGNLGAGAVQDASAQLEKALHERSGSERIEPLRMRMAKVLAPLAEQLGTALIESATKAPSTPPSAADPARLKAVLEEMLQYLSDFDGAAGDCLDANRELLRTLFTPEEFAQFEKRVESFAFGEAQAQIAQALKDSPIA